MMHRTLGKSGLEVSAMGFGCWAIGGPWDMGDTPAGWGEIDDAVSISALQHALDLGITFYDTAANYGAGHSERILAQAFAGKRDQVVIATKFGYVVDEAAKQVNEYPALEDVAANLRADCEASLRRLNTDYIDLFQFHVNDFPAERAGEVRDVLEDLVAAGKIRFYGWSTDHPASARVFAAGEHCVAIQHNMNVIHDSGAVLAVCEENSLASINRGPLGMGLLTGKYTHDAKWDKDDVRSGAQWFVDGFMGPILDNLPAIRSILTSDGRTLAQGALAWLWGRSPLTIPIPGIKTVKQLEENAAAMDFGPLTADQMAEIDQLLGRAKPA